MKKIPNPLIVALDVPTLKEASRLVRLLKKQVSLFKVGLNLFTSAGPDAVKMIRDEGGQVFLDLKFHDIPNTVETACSAAARLGVFMLNVHASGGLDMLQAAQRAVRQMNKVSRPLLLGVTVLTSQSKNKSTRGTVARLAKLSQKSALDGVVCSPHEILSVRKACGPGFVIVTPGVRPALIHSKILRDDQSRVATPGDAIRRGADYIVVGRPILAAPDPKRAVAQILDEMKMG